MFGLSKVRLGIYVAAAALIGYLVWREHSLTKLVGDERAARVVAEKAIEAKDRELEQIRRDMEKQRNASNDYQTELESLKAARAFTPVRTVRLCVGPAIVSAPAGGSDAPDAEGLQEAPGQDPRAGPDIGAELYALADEADNLAAQCEGLIRWHEP